MAQMPIAVGNAVEQQKFIKNNEAFLEEHPKLHALLTKVFIRTLVISRAEKQMEEIGEGVSRTESERTAILDKEMAQVVVFYLGRAAAADFGELLILAGNGLGIGAYKIVRGMYERVVTAAFIAANPAEARLFLSHSYIEREKLLNRVRIILPDVKDERTPEQVKEFDDACQEARAKLKSSSCSKCRQPITQEAWTRKNLDQMAEKSVAPGLANSYAYCYLIPTYYSHATAFGMESRIRETETGHTFEELSEKEARQAVLYGHGLILRLLKFQNSYFELGLDSEVEARFEMFPKIWKGQTADESAAP
jgi:Family of unknown function (DUF5677)